MPDISKITTPDGTAWDVKDLKARGVELTQAEYDALPSSKLTDGVDYYITDAQAGTPLATEIAMSTSDNTSVAEAIGKIGTMATASWTASSSTVSGTRLTDNVTLTKGIWLVTLIVPNSDGSIAIGVRSVGWTGIIKFSILNSLNSFSLPLEVVDDSREYYFDSQQSIPVNFSYLERGGISAVKIK